MSVRKYWYYYNDEDDGGNVGPKDPLNTFSGSIVQFISSQNYPFQGLVVNIDPVQAGSGDPSPENVRPITGFTGVNVTRTGKNLFNPSWSAFSTKSGQPYAAQPIPHPQDGYITATLIDKNNGESVSGCYIGVSSNGYNSNGAGVSWLLQNGTIARKKVTVNNRFFASVYPVNEETFTKILARFDIQIEVGEDSTDFEQYTPPDTLSVSWTDEAGTVYSGTLDVLTGKLTVTHKSMTVPASSISGAGSGIYIYPVSDMKSGNALDGICDKFKTVSASGVFGVRFGASNNYLYFYNMPGNIPGVTDLQSFKTWAGDNPIQIVYPLATPVEYTLDPETIDTLVGLNNVWSDTGDVEVTVYGTPVT